MYRDFLDHAGFVTYPVHCSSALRSEIDGHSKRVGALSRVIGSHLGLSESILFRLEVAGTIHDQGKYQLPENLLMKTGPLKPREYMEVQKHPEMGAAVYVRYMKMTGAAPDEILLKAIMEHHERWDGSGYPGGLKGNAISIWGQIVSFADVLDALSSDRCYRPAFSLEETFRFLSEKSGSWWQPELIQAADRAREDLVTVCS